MTERVRVADVVSPILRIDPARLSPGGAFTYIDLGSVSQSEKRIVGEERLAVEDAPSRARQIVATGDVLVSTVRPNLNSVARVPGRLDGAIASTGFAVLRARPDRLDSGYAFHWVRSPEFIDAMERLSTGASYPAVSDRIVKESTLPMPSIDEQRRIAAVLDQADELRAKRRASIDLADSLTESVFVEMFGVADPSWRIVEVGSLAAPRRDAIRTGPFGSQLLHSEFVDDGVRVLGIDNAVRDRFDWGERRFITETKFKKLRRFQAFPGDVLVTIMGTCGRTAIVPDDVPTSITTKHLCCITLDHDQCLPVYLWAVLRFHREFRRQLGANARGAVMPGLNMGLIKSARLAVPPMNRQRQFGDRVEAAKQSLERAMVGATHLDELFASLQDRAFRGEL